MSDIITKPPSFVKKIRLKTLDFGQKYAKIFE